MAFTKASRQLPMKGIHWAEYEVMPIEIYPVGAITQFSLELTLMGLPVHFLPIHSLLMTRSEIEYCTAWVTGCGVLECPLEPIHVSHPQPSTLVLSVEHCTVYKEFHLHYLSCTEKFYSCFPNAVSLHCPSPHGTLLPPWSPLSGDRLQQ